MSSFVSVRDGTPVGRGRGHAARDLHAVRPRVSPGRGRDGPASAARHARRRAILPLEAFELYVKGLVAATPAVEQRFLESAMRIAPTDPRIQLELWNVYSAQELHDRALEAANSVPRDSPLFRRARFAVAQSLIALKRFDGAIHELEALYKAEPSAAVSNALGIVQLRRGSTAEADEPGRRHTSPRAVKRIPRTRRISSTWATRTRSAANNADALASLRETVRLDPDRWRCAPRHECRARQDAGRAARARAGAVAWRVGRSESLASPAAACLPASNEWSWTSVSRPPLGRRRVHAGAARPAGDGGVSPGAGANAGRSASRHGGDRSACGAPSTCRRTPTSHTCSSGTLYRRAGRLPEAIDAFKIAIWSRETAAAHVALGSALLESGDTEGAKRSAERALVLAPTSEAAREFLKRHRRLRRRVNIDADECPIKTSVRSSSEESSSFSCSWRRSCLPSPSSC